MCVWHLTNVPKPFYKKLEQRNRKNLVSQTYFVHLRVKRRETMKKLKFLLAVPSVTGNCSPPFESFFSTCITHVSRSQTPFNSYADMRQICHFIGGHLYKIQVDHRLKEDWVKSYSWGKTYYLPYIFMPRDGRWGAYCFCPVYYSVIPSFRNSVILFETWTLPITFQP